ncbi:RimJ/RimL family protein N-acetyltransferase [Knoellia remsis]|uniref:RimJ/RimL family protein N-acetyltransferase n=1 Tax=Knoellia remsis TaxID=407159 RepID=A0A2T0UTW2_9MICO|nr:GNAT family N-acetyltransferase [Knoellia remsis]PRY61334.1 RimJ/RimL family protein N-acetyltransferase [Knoellia remsis]
MPSAPPPSLVTERLRLRRWRDSDLEPYAAMNADPEVMRYFPAPLTRAESDAMVGRLEAGFDEHGYGLWAVERRDCGAFVGFTGLGTLPAGSPCPGGVEVGWRLARSAWGVGFATEAARASLADGIRRIGMPEVWSWSVASNIASIAVMRRLGMTHRWDGPNPKVPLGHPLSDTVGYHLDAATWSG